MLPIKLNIEKDFLKEEIRCEHLVNEKTKKLWAVQLDLLNEVSKLCEKHNIQWFADGGTLLGAVRHNGYIPWDDDIDIAMFRDEYDRFFEIAQKELSGPYFVQRADTDSMSCLKHIRIINKETFCTTRESMNNLYFAECIFIDIFPMDNFPSQTDDFNHLLAQNIIYKLNNKILKGQYLKNNLSIEKCRNKITENFIRYENEIKINNKKYNDDFLTLICLMKKDRVFKRKKENYKDVVYLPFEMLKVPCPIGYAEELTNKYGNWSEFVKGTQLHTINYFMPEVSYRDVLI